MGPQRCFVITIYLTCFHHGTLFCSFVTVLIKLLFPVAGSSLHFSRGAADPGKENSPWLLQREKGDPGYDDVELGAFGTSTVAFP